MYDNIDLILGREQCQGTDLLRVVPQCLTKVSNHGISEYGEYLSGYLDSLKISVSERRVKISDSSICKFYLGNNFRTLTKGDIKRAMEKISDSLHLPIDLAHVTRLDVAQNLIMKQKESSYYQYLGECQYYDRLEQNNGLYYSNQKRQLLLYGKEHEQRIKRQPIPELYKDRNVLRIELRFKKRLAQQLKRPEITVDLLYNDSFYSELVKRWRNEYLSIQKINSNLNYMEPTGSKKKFIENLAMYSVLELGQPKVLDKIKEWQDGGKISKKQAFDLRSSIRKLCTIPKDEGGNELIYELDRKVKEAARYC